MDDMTIGTLARKGEVGVETIRYYQRRGLLETPGRSGGNGLSGGTRRYGDGDVRRLRFIRQAQAAGFTLEEIRELLTLDASVDRDQARGLARARIVALDARIKELQAARTALTRLAHDCALSDGPCPILNAFDGV